MFTLNYSFLPFRLSRFFSPPIFLLADYLSKGSAETNNFASLEGAKSVKIILTRSSITSTYGQKILVYITRIPTRIYSRITPGLVVYSHSKASK